MDLRTSYPRSPKDKLLGIYSLKRTIDKTKAYNDGDGHLGEYHFDCPHDKPLFAFLGVDANTFAQQVGKLQTDEAIGAWIEREYLSKKSPSEIAQFNEQALHWKPAPGTESEAFFDSERKRLGRPDLHTWFDLLDVDEGREVKEPTAV
jgi:hypothetical protein